MNEERKKGGKGKRNSANVKVTTETVVYRWSMGKTGADGCTFGYFFQAAMTNC